MNNGTRHVSLPGYAIAAVLVVGVLALAVSYLGSSVSADSPTHGRSSDCFGGALSSDPIHCEVFEWAHNEGVIDVDGVYRAGGALFIYLTQADRLDDAALKKMLGKSQEVARRTGDHECVLDSILCGSGVLAAERLDIPGYILPRSSVYQVIKLFPGGAEARRSSAGWRAFEQFWPEASGGAGGARGADGDFDISGVDRANFPTFPNCAHHQLITGTSSSETRCFVEVGMGATINYWDKRNDKVYFYVKAGVGEEESTIAAAKTAIVASQPDYYTEERLVVVAVPHGVEEMWRWSLLLDRFANSSGNTLGINRVVLGFNTLGGLGKDRKYVFPLADAPDLTDHIRERRGFPDGLLWRLIIQVSTLEFEKTVAGLPGLLRQLEIPESAVGLIYEQVFASAERGYPEPGVRVEDLPAGPVAHPDTGGVSDSGQASWWKWSAGAASIVVAGLVALFAVRPRLATKRGRSR